MSVRQLLFMDAHLLQIKARLIGIQSIMQKYPVMMVTKTSRVRQMMRI